VLVISGTEGAPLAVEAIAGDPVWDAIAALVFDPAERSRRARAHQRRRGGSGGGAAADVKPRTPRCRPWRNRDNFADASLDNSSIAFVLDCHVWQNNNVRMTARNVSASTVGLAAAPLPLEVMCPLNLLGLL
jgi:hypothetical protein